MSLKVWLPLLGNLKNQGTGNYTEPEIASGNSWASEGKIGDSSLKLTKIQNILPASSLLSCMAGAKQMSWCFWVKINNAWSKDWLDGIRWYSTDGTNTHTSRMEFYTNCTKIGTWYQDGSISGKNIAPGVWTHLAATYDYNTGKVSFYINGVLQETKNTLNTSHYCRGDFYIGDNEVDILENDVRIYDHCLSAAEVHEISQGLVLHYKLDGNNPNLAIGTNTNNTATNAWYLSMQTGDKTVSIENEDSIPIVVITRGTIERSGWCYLQYSKIDRQSIKTDTTYTVSFDVWSSNSGSITLGGLLQGNGTNYMTNSRTNIKTTVTANKWNHILLQCKTKTDFSDITISSQVIYMYISESLCVVNSILKFKNMKLEEGTTETPWCPNSSDALYSILGYDTTIIEDSSGYGHNGTINSTISYENSQGGRYSTQAYIGSGTAQSVNTPNILFENMLQGTLNIWINRKSTDTNWRVYTFFADSYNWTGNSRDFLIIGSTGSQRVVLDCCSNTYEFTPDLNKWYMCTISWDLVTHTAKMYVNGELKSTKVDDKIDTTYASKHNLHYFGNRYLTNSTYTGDYLLSDARIYCTQLLDNDIKMLYNVSMKVDNLGNIHTYELEETNSQNKILKTGITKSANFFEDLYYDKIAHIGKQMNDNILNPNDLEVITTNSSNIKTGSLGFIPAETIQALAGKTLIFSYDVCTPGERLSEVNGDTAYNKIRYGIHGAISYVNASGTSGTNYPFASYLAYSGDSKHTIQTWTIPTNYQSYGNLNFSIQNFDKPSNNNSNTWFIKNVRLEVQENTTNGWISGTNLIEI